MNQIRMIAEEMIRSRFAVALTGAGISTASGIPDFRGPSGIWKTFDPSLFHISYFMKDPMSSWKLFVEKMYDTIKKAKPNISHYALSRLEEMGVIKGVITQNIDDLHRKANTKEVIELHGNINFSICTQCGRRFNIEESIKEVRANRVPLCPYCGGLIKPDVVFFGEPLNDETLRRAYDFASKSDLFLVLGSSLSVSPANQLPIVAKSNGAKLIIINAGPTEFDPYADIRVEGRVEEVFPRICKLVEEMIASKSGICDYD
ncbi:MAG: NAD-dependent deacylase [Caldisphaeraceae archaeon]|nr:NAD-dependent deacylase [Caldisphaeraceae archaeon]